MEISKDRPYESPFFTSAPLAKLNRNQDLYNWAHYRDRYADEDQSTEHGEANARYYYRQMLDSVTLENPPMAEDIEMSDTKNKLSNGFTTLLFFGGVLGFTALATTSIIIGFWPILLVFALVFGFAFMIFG